MHIHENQPILAAGRSLGDAEVAVIMLHGRGAGAQDIISLAPELQRDDFAYLAPEAADASWYPFSFLMPLERNEPHLSSALGVIEKLSSDLVDSGIPQDRQVLLGFSQGTCLLLEYAARNPRRYGALIGFSGGLIGPDGTLDRYSGSLDGTPVYLGCSDIDPFIPRDRVIESARVLRELGADVTDRLFPGMGHSVIMEEILAARELLGRVQATR
jgi:predicted esterase